MQLQQQENEFQKRNVKITIVTFEANYLARSYAEETNYKFPILVDESREVYSAYNMLSASFWEIWGPRTWAAYLKEFARGNWLKKSEGDISQRGGDVLIDPAGILRLHHVGDGPSDRPAVSSILLALDKAG